MTPKEFQQAIKSSDVYLLDVRTPEEYKEGHISGAHNLDVTNEDFIEKAKAELPKDKSIALYCKSGKRAAVAQEKLDALGYKTLFLDGGIMAWEEDGLPVT